MFLWHGQRWMPRTFTFGDRYEIVIDDATTPSCLRKLIIEREAARDPACAAHLGEHTEASELMLQCHKYSGGYRRLSPLEAEVFTWSCLNAPSVADDSLCSEWLPDGLENAAIAPGSSSATDPSSSGVAAMNDTACAPIAAPPPPKPPASRLVGSPFYVKEGDLIVYRIANEELKILSKEERLALEREVRRSIHCCLFHSFGLHAAPCAYICHIRMLSSCCIPRAACHCWQRSEITKTKTIVGFQSAPSADKPHLPLP